MPSPVPRRPSRLARRSATPASPSTTQRRVALAAGWNWPFRCGQNELIWQRWAAAGAVLCLLPLGWATWHGSPRDPALTAATQWPLLAQLELGPAHNEQHADPPPAPELPDGPADAERQPAADENGDDVDQGSTETEPSSPATEPEDPSTTADVSDTTEVADEGGAGSADYDDPSSDQPSGESKTPPASTKARPRTAAPPNNARPRPIPPKSAGANSGRTNPKPNPSSNPPAAGDTAVDSPSAAEQRKLAPPPTAPRQLSPRQQALKQQLEQCLQFYFVNKPLNTRDDSAWSIMHSFLGFGAPTPVAVGSPQGQRANAIAWMCANKPCGGRELLYLQNGLVIGREGPGYQGHPAQFLAMLAQVHVSPNYELRVANQRLTVENLIESEKATCRDGMELTFKLISLSHYLPSTASWQNQQGQTWDIPRLIRAEIGQPINGAACGGTHRLMGLSCAIYNRQQEGLPIDGQWARADKYIRDYHRYTFSLQNPDGSFSSDWFKRRANWGENDRKLQTTGHIAEWMIYSVPEDELHDQRLFRAVQLLVNLMSQNRHYDWAVGPRGHAIRALRLYHERALGGRPADWMGGQMTRRSVSRSR